jgi:hypothetical protein
MATVFGAEENIEHVTKFTGTSKEALVQQLHNHELFLTMDPNHISHERLAEAKKKHTVPGEIAGRVAGETIAYDQKDSIPGYAAKFLPGMSSSTQHYQMTNLSDGLYIHLDSALDVVIDRVVQVREGSDGLELYENFGVNCSKLLVGVIKRQYAEHWDMFHKTWVEKAGGQVTSQS